MSNMTIPIIVTGAILLSIVLECVGAHAGASFIVGYLYGTAAAAWQACQVFGKRKRGVE